MTDFRALCAELVDAWDNARTPSDFMDTADCGVIWKIRAALAQPDPQEAMIPDQYKGHQVHVYRAGFHAGYTHGLTRANAAPARPEPQGPTDEEIRDLWSWAAGQDQGPWPTQQHCFARAVLARWGRPAIEPVLFGERLPGPGDYDAEWRCWVLRLRRVWDPYFTPTWALVANSEIRDTDYWLPHHALPVPQNNA
jgi:hypothetical protein